MGTESSNSETHFHNIIVRDEEVKNCPVVLRGATGIGSGLEDTELRVTGGRPPTVALCVDRCYRLTGDGLDQSAVYLGEDGGAHKFRIDTSQCGGRA